MTRRFRFDQLALVFILAFAFFFRVWHLGMKPPHFDEGINGHFVNQMWQDGFYRYDPKNFHGPLYFYFLQFAEIVFGPTLVGYRFVTGLISVGAVWVLAQHQRFFGRAALWAALFIALSPAFVFYSRYAIHESLFILAQLIFSYGFFEFFYGDLNDRRRALTKISCGFFSMVMVKETMLIFVVTWAIAFACVKVGLRLPILQRTLGGGHASDDLKIDGEPWQADAIIAFSIGAFITLTVFTGFLLNPHGAEDLFTAFAVWTKTGTGATGHEKPFPYWLKLFSTYEWPLLIGLVFSPVAFFATQQRVRLIAFFAFGTWLAYSLVPYKTPWLILNILWPVALIAGEGLEVALESLSKTSWRAISRVVLLTFIATFAVSVYKMAKLNFVDFVNPAEPYVYVQTTKQYQTVIDVIENELRVHPEDLVMKVAALNRDPWPLPFSLEEFPNLQWGKVETAQLDSADVVLIDAASRPALEAKLKGHFWVMPFKIRDAYEDGFAYLNFAKFSSSIPRDTPVFKSAEVHP